MEKVKEWNYQHIKKIGAGGFGEVHKCRNLVTNENVAIKMIAIENACEGVSSNIIREVSLLLEMEHDNIVRLLDVMSNGEHVFLVFEYLDLDLRSFIDKHKVALNSLTIKAILKQILLGLAYCHSVKVVHRDLKPNNLLIDLKNSRVKLADFGLARAFGVPRNEHPCGDRYGPYKAPEALVSTSVFSAPIDLWSVGCIFAEMISGKPLFLYGGQSPLSQIYRGKPTEETFHKASEALPSYPHLEPAFLAEKFATLEPDAYDLLSKLLWLNPKDRITAVGAIEHVYLSDVANVPLRLPRNFLSRHFCGSNKP